MRKFINSTKSRLLLFTLFLLFAGGISPAWADDLIETFDAVTVTSRYELSNGWVMKHNNGNYQGFGGSYDCQIKSGNYDGNTGCSLYFNYSDDNEYIVVPTTLTGEVSFYAKRTTSSGTKTVTFYSVTKDGDNWIIGSQLFNQSLGSSWTKYSFTLTEPTMVAVKLKYAWFDQFSATTYQATSGPALDVKDGSTKLTSPYAYNFGLAEAGATKVFTLSNPGTETATVSVSHTGDFGAELSATSIPAGESVTLTVTMPDATCSDVITISSTDEGIEDFVINVSGTIRDPNKVYLDFADGQIPDGWTAVGYSSGYTTYNWVTYTGYIGYGGTSFSYEGTFTSPILNFTNGEEIFFETSKFGTSTYYNPSVTVEYTTDATGATGWTAIGSAFTGGENGNWISRSVTIPVDGVKRIRFRGYYISLRNIYGGELPAGASFAINTDGTTQSLGVAAIGGTLEKTFTITNSGNANLEVTFTPSEGVSIPNYITFTDALNWGNIHMYYWDNGPEWPGVAMTEIGENEYGQKQYRAVVPDGVTGIIFNGNGKQTVNITSYTACTEGYYATDSQDGMGHYEVGSWNNGPGWNVEAGKTRDFTVVMNTETAGAKSGNIELAFTAVNVAYNTFTIPVTGAVIPDGALVVDFNDNQLPDLWTNSSSYPWTFEDGVAKGQYSPSIGAYMTTPKLIFSSGDIVVIKAKRMSDITSRYIRITGSSDNGETWTAYSTKLQAEQGLTYPDWGTIILTDIPTTVNKLQIEGFYAIIDEIIGLTYDPNDPKMGVYTDAECTAANKVTATSVTADFGFVTAAPDAVTYYIKNDGIGTMTLSKSDDPAGLTVTLDKTEVAAGEKATLTIAMPVENNGGYHGGDIAVTAEGLGTFTIKAQGVVVEEGKLNLNFATDNAPSSWTLNNWEKNNGGYMRAGYSSTIMETSALTAVANEQLVIVAKNEYTGSSYTFGVNYKKVEDEEWSTLIAAANLGTSWKTLTATIAEAGSYQLQFVGNYANIQRIYGLSKPNAPEMVLYDGNAVAAASYNFGKVTDENDATWTLTVKNEGLAKLEDLAVALSGDNADHYTAVITGATGEGNDEIEAGAQATVTVTQLKDNLGAHSATLTISATGLDSKEIALSGNTVDHTALNIDFDSSSEWPVEILEHGTSWSVYYSSYSNYGWAQQTNYSTASSLILTPLTIAAATDKFQFDAWKYSGSGSYHDLNVRYTTDGGITWNDYDWNNYDWSATETLRQQLTTSEKTFEVTGLNAGTVAFEFNGKYVRLDNITGDMKVTSAPLVEFNTVSDNISNANLSADATATYTLANKGNADYVGAVAATNVTVAVEGEDVTFENNTLTIPAGKTATITAKMAFAAPYGEKTGSLGITSESWVGDINVSYTATLVDPTDFVEDFAGNAKPAGWYSENWTYSDGNARVYAGVAKPMITEKIGAEEGKNTLTFDAKAYYGSDEQTLSVYTSTDRKTWSEAQQFTLTADVQNFSLTALDDGEYYVKFEAANAVVDNLAGVKRLEAPAHDLYEVSTTMAATGTPGASYTATVVGVSLRADENVVAELWFKKGDDYTKVAELTDQAMTVNTNKTFTLTGNLPAEEGEYKAWVTVKNNDNSAYFNTDEIDFTLAHTHTMSITAFPNAAGVQADDNNEYTGTFFVTVQNTGSAAIAAENVSVSLVDNADETNVFTSTWTAENSNVLYMNTSNGNDDIATDCTLKAWCWNTDTDGEWITFTKVNDGFWSLNLNGKANFIVCRFNPDGTDENPWNNVWNQSGDLALADGNLIKFNGYGNSGLTFNSESMAYLDPSMTTTLKVTVTGTLTDGENASFAFKAKENMNDTFYGSGLTSNISVTAAPVIVLDEAEGTIASTGQNRKVSLAHKFVAGWNTICLPFAIDATEIHAEAKALEFTACSGNDLTFSPVTALEAGKPYVIYVPEEIPVSSPITFTGKTVSADEAESSVFGSVEFKGMYSPKAAGELTGNWGLTAAGKIVKAGANTSMKGFRAYLIGDLANARAIFLGGDGNTTGINRLIENGTLKADEPMYNTSGQQVGSSYRGIVIQNGKKYVIK